MRQIPVVDPAIYQARRRKSGLIFGLLCGLAFAVATWGIDGLLLSQSHAYLPWFKFLIGIGICAGLGALTGWIAAKMDNALLSAFLWLVTAGLFSVLTGWLSYSGTQMALRFFLPQIAGQVSYNPTVAANFRIGFAFLGVGLAGVIVGFIELPLVDTAATSASRFSRWLALSVGIPVFLLAGIAATDGLINAPLRAPIVAIHDLLQFAQANQGKKLESSVIRETHYAALSALGDEIYQPYRIALKSYDDTFSQVNVLVAFKDGMAACSVYVGTPSYCKPGVGGTQSQSQSGAVSSPTNLTQVTPSPTQSTVATSAQVNATSTSAPSSTSLETDFSQDTALLPEFQSDIQALNGLNTYDLSVKIDPAQLTLNGQMSLDYTNHENVPLDRLYFHLLPNGHSSYGNGSLAVQDIRVDGAPVTATLSAGDTILEVPLPQTLQPGQSAQIEMVFNGQVPVDFGWDQTPSGYGIYNYSSGVLALSGWYPILAVYDDHGWNLDGVSAIGDSVYSDMAFYRVNMETPQDQVVAATGVNAASQASAGTASSVYISGPVRDFLIMMSPDFQVSSQMVDGTQVNSYFLPGNQAAGEIVKSIASDSLSIYNAKFGEYPYRELDVVESPMRNASGVEFPGIVMIGSDEYIDPAQPALAVTVAHEVAHQWWYNLVGNDVFEEPWLDEALASFTSSLYLEEKEGIQAYIGLFDYFRNRYDKARQNGEEDQVTQTLAHFESLPDRGVYGAIVYAKGALFFSALRQEIGDQAFFQALQNYFQSERYQISSAPQLLDAFEAASGRQLDDFYQKWLYSPQP